MGRAQPDVRHDPPDGSRPAFGRALAALVVALWALVPVSAAADPLDVLYSPRPPYYTVDAHGTVDGIVAGPAKQAFEEAGLETLWSRVSFNRQIQMIQENTAPLCAIGWFKNPEREAFAKFTEAIYQDKAMVALARSQNAAVARHGTLAALMADADLQMGTKLGFSYGTEVDTMISTLAPRRLTTDQTPVGMIRMLMGRRFDYMISAPEEALYLKDTLGAEAESLEVIPLSDLSPQNKRYIMCTKRTDDAVIAALNAAIQLRQERHGSAGGPS